MDLIDHLLTFPNETAALGVLTPMGFAPNGVWDRRIVDPGVKLITVDRVMGSTTEDPNLIEQETIPGYHVSIALPEASEALEGIPPKALRVIENRELTGPDKAFHEYAVSFKGLPEGVASDMPAAQVNRVGGKIENLKFRISPRWYWHTEYPDPL